MLFSKLLAAICAGAMTLTGLPSAVFQKGTDIPARAAEHVVPVMAKAGTTILGDANKDGIVDVSDAQSILDFAVTMGCLSSHSYSSSIMAPLDVDCDGNITAADARAVLEYSSAIGDGQNEGDLSSYLYSSANEDMASGEEVYIAIDKKTVDISELSEPVSISVNVTGGAALYAYDFGIQIPTLYGNKIQPVTEGLNGVLLSSKASSSSTGLHWFGGVNPSSKQPFTGEIARFFVTIPEDTAPGLYKITFRSDNKMPHVGNNGHTSMFLGEGLTGKNQLTPVVEDGYINIVGEPLQTTTTTEAATTATTMTTTTASTTTTAKATTTVRATTTTTTTATTATTAATTTTETTTTTEPVPVELYRVTEEGVVYRIMKENGTCWSEVCGYTEDIPADVEIPVQASSYPVRKIAKEAFYKCARLQSIVLPESVQEIGEAAFAVTSLRDVWILNDRCQIYASPTTFTNGFRGGRTDELYGNYFDGVIHAYDGSEALRFAWNYGCSYQTMYEPTWKLDAAGTLTISGSGSMRNYGKDYMNEHAPWYEMREDVRKVIISPGITGIGDCAFEGCKNMTSVSIPEGVICIPWSSFDGCESLSEISIPQSVTEIDEYAFYGTAWLEAKQQAHELVVVNNILIDGQGCTGDVVIPDGVKCIPGMAFMGNDMITSVFIPDSVTSIGERAFAFCGQLRTVEIPDSVSEIEYNAFNYCESLQSVKIPASVTKLVDGAFPGEELHGIFAVCPNLKNVEFQNGIQKIGHYSFAFTAITDVTIPETVTELGTQAFYHCESLKTITILNPDCNIYKYYDWETGLQISDNLVICGYDNSTAQEFAAKYGYPFKSLGKAPGNPDLILASGSCGNGLTYKIDGTRTLTISGKGELTEAPWNESYTGKILSVVIEDGVTCIGNGVFTWNEDITSVTLPDSVTTLGNRAFGQCTALSYVRLPAGLKEFPDGHEPGDVFYGEGVFGRCESLKSIELPEGLEYIGSFTFFLSGLTEVTIPTSVKTIAGAAFGACQNMQTVTILNPDCVIKGENRTFFNDDSAYDNDPFAYSGEIVAPEGSTAQAFAQKLGYTFRTLGTLPSAPELGNVNGDAVINASDAAVVLIAAAAIGAGNDPGLTEAQKTAADVNKDKSINASDAAVVLIYAAAVGAGKTDAKISDYVH